MEVLIQLSVALIGGLLMSRIAKKLNLPAVTAYLVAGLLLGPFCIGLLKKVYTFLKLQSLLIKFKLRMLSKVYLMLK